jgi:hypothetical protein
VFFSQSTPPPFDGALNTPSTVLPSSVDTSQSRSPQELSYEAGNSSGSALNRRANNQILWEERPAPRRPLIRLEVRNDMRRVNGQRTTARESFAYACETLPYNAGLQPHAYVDNHKYATRGKDNIAEDLYTMDECTEEEDHGVGKSKSPEIFRRLARKKKKVSKMIALRLPNSRKPSTLPPVESHPPNSQPPVMSSMANLMGHYPGNANRPTRPNHPSPPTSPPPPYATIAHQPTNIRSSKDSPFAL